ncbi:NifU family protein [Bradyrhizobium pachyrhizi]|uniref:NifU family protein n=1 Tax=Bradyrhizobium pachyrhizi TaxID=280333 RepID=UPI0024B09E0B|nr:NifU family protein [Bradyrhizobium pachyrhizi]WFU54709.1 NifU family protein [Bradyrhizobium pachyrhizi]
MLVPEPLRHPLIAKKNREQSIRAVTEKTRPHLRCDGSDGRFVEIGRGRSIVKLTGVSVLRKLSGRTLERIQARLIERIGKLVGLIPLAAAARSRV